MIEILATITPTGLNPIFFWGSFLLVYAVCFAVFSQIKIFGENKGIVMTMSAVISLMVALSPSVSEILSGSLPSVGILVVFIVCALLAINLLYPGKSFPGEKYVIVLLIIVVGVIFLSSSWVDVVTMQSDKVIIGGTAVDTASIQTIIAVAVIITFLLLASNSIKGKSGGGGGKGNKE